MGEQQSQGQEREDRRFGRNGGNKGTHQQRRALEETFDEIANHMKPLSLLDEVKRSAARALVWAPVAFGVGWGLIKLTGKPRL